MPDAPHLRSLSAPTRAPAPHPTTSSELITVLAHFHRAEIARMAGWRDRIDRTTNWAITVVAGVLSVSLSTPNSPHGLLLFAMLLVLLLLVIEARRYRFFDVFRNRVRLMERNYFAQIFAPEPNATDLWMSQLGHDLRGPAFLTTHGEALSKRLRRNYCWLFSVLALAWIIKSSYVRPIDSVDRGHFVDSFAEWVLNISIGPLPGWITIATLVGFYAWILYASLVRHKKERELVSGRVHV